MRFKYTTRFLISMLAINSILTQTAWAAPQEVMTHKAIPVWDYHLPNYDKDGKVRVKPETTIFDTSGIKPPQNPATIPNLLGGKYDFGRDVIIEMSNQKKEDQDWIKGIYKVTKVAESTDNPNAEAELEYTVNNDKLIISKNSRALSNNGEFTIKIYSQNRETGRATIELQKDAPELRIHPNFQAVVNQDILFELRNFNYAITNPIYQVILDGKVLEGGCVDYHIVSNLIRLERSGVIKEEGRHTLEIKAKGFKDAKLDFIVKKELNGYVPPVIDHDSEIKSSRAKLDLKNYAKADAVTSASVSGGGSGGSSGGSGGGGSTVMGAQLIFDFDMVSNAYILRSIGMETEESKKVIELWESASKESARMKGSDDFYEWGAYKNWVMKEELAGRIGTFEDYIKSEEAEKAKGGAYNVKYVLQDGLLGETMLFNRTNDKEIPTVKAEQKKVGEDLVLKVENPGEWITKIKAIKIAGYTKIAKAEYTIGKDSITISKSRITAGSNQITIEAEGYKDLELKFVIEKDEVKLALQKEFNFGEDVVITGFTKDYANSMRGITLNGKGLLSVSAAGTSGNFDLKGENLILFKNNFKNTQSYTLRIESDKYETREVVIKLKGDVPVEENTGKKLPMGLVSTIKLNQGKDLEYGLGGSFSREDEAYKKAVEKGSVEIDKKQVKFEVTEVYGSYKLKIAKDLIPQTGEFTLTIKGIDYEKKDVQVTIKVVEAPKPVEPTPTIPTPTNPTTTDSAIKVSPTVALKEIQKTKKMFGDGEDIKIIFEVKDNADIDYLVKNGYEVTLNGTKLGYSNMTIQKSNYNKPVYAIRIDANYLTSVLKAGKNILKITQPGYNDQTVEFEF